ncbi:MAG: AraC family transcriptional regulator [Rhodospirillales bacterium]|nr:AraC family transcriptional regulator [Rhodospirillales bacterium]
MFRTELAGRNATLLDAFQVLRSRPGLVDLRDDGRIVSASITLPPGEGEGYWELFDLAGDAYVVVSNCSYREPRSELVPSEGFIECHITLAGSVLLGREDDEPVDLQDPVLVMCKQGRGADYTVWCDAGPRRLISLYLRPDFVAAIAGTGAVSPMLGVLLDELPGRFACYQLPIKPALAEITRQLIMPPYTGKRRLLFVQAQIYALLCLLLDEIHDADLTAGLSEIFTERDLAKFEAARGILMSCAGPPPTVAELARSVGTNATKLKKGFKLVYGTTLFEFALNERMRRAMHLLSVERMSIGTVADAVGYQHQASFSAAFKKYYGMLPKAARRAGAGLGAKTNKPDGQSASAPTDSP